MLFKIITVYAGWFEVDINRQCILTNSDFLNCDAPRLLLEALGQLAEKETGIRWLCWQDEPGANILRLEKKGKLVDVEVYDSQKTSLELDFTGESLEQHVDELCYRSTEDFQEMIDAITEEFSLYENGNGGVLYRKEWGEFPQAEYDWLRFGKAREDEEYVRT